MKKTGYTMIELLIVIAVIGLLASFFMISYPATQKKGRDARRRSDLKQYQTALETFANKNNSLYPTSGSNAIDANAQLCVDLGFAAADDCAVDPKDGFNVCASNICRYYYRTDTCGVSVGDPCASQFVLWSALEQTDSSGGSLYYIVCSNGQSGENSSAPSTANCPL